MPSLEDRYGDFIGQVEGINANTPRAAVYPIRQRLEELEFELHHTSMSPERNEKLLKLSLAANAVLERKLYAIRHPLVWRPMPPSNQDRRRQR